MKPVTQRKVAETARKSKATSTQAESSSDVVKKVAKKQKLIEQETELEPIARRRARLAVNTRCEPLTILDMVGLLNPPQKDRLTQLGFGWVLKFKMDALRSRDLIEYRMDCLDPDRMVLDLGGQGKLPVLGLRNGLLDPPVASGTAVLGHIRESLGLDAKGWISTCRGLGWGGTDDITIRCVS